MKAILSLMGLLYPIPPQLKQKIPVFYFLLFSVFYSLSALAQSSPALGLKGKVFDAKNGMSLPGATVKTRQSGTLVITGQDGQFSLDVKDTSGVLDITFIGYKPVAVQFDRKRTGPFRIGLTEDGNLLKEVTVSTGYQTLSRELVTGSVVQLDSAIINRRVSTDIVSRLEGVVPGLIFNRNTSKSLNGTVDLSVRGHSTLFSGDQPLIVLDNFPYDGDIGSINPNDVETITVLKDAASASIWGVRSGNGVIVITTKKGKRNQRLRVDFNADVTVGNKPDLYYNPVFLASSDYIDVEQTLFAKGYYNALTADPAQVISPVVQLLADQKAGLISPDVSASRINALRTNDVRADLQKYFYRPSVNQQYSAGFRGGNANSDYFLSAGEDYNLSNRTGDQNNRATLNAGYNFYPVKNLQIGVGLNYVKSDVRNNSPVSSVYSGGRFGNQVYPYARLADDNGNALAISRDYNYAYISQVPQQGFLDWQFRPLDELHNADNQTNTVDNRLNLSVQYTVLQGLKADLKYQYQDESVHTANYFNSNTYFSRNLINQYTQNTGGILSYPIPLGGILQGADGKMVSQRVRGQLNYNLSWAGNHALSAILGSEISSQTSSASSGIAYGYNQETQNNYTQINYQTYYSLNPVKNSSAQVPNSQSFGQTTDRYLSYFSNLGYTYLDRYTLSISGRIDRSNLFGVSTNQKAVPLYSTGLAWNISKEPFYQLPWLPYARLRASYGYNANINKTATAVTTILQQSNAYYTGVPYASIANPGNQDLRWEKVKIINIGIDFALKKEILSGSIEYYSKKGLDLFGNSPLAPSTGLSSFYGNTAATAGHGIDINLKANLVNKRDFKWSADFIYSYALDRVEKYDVQSTVSAYLSSGAGDAGVITPLVGKPVFAIYSYRSASLTHDAGDPQGYLNGKLSTNYAAIIKNTTTDSLYFNGSARPVSFGAFRNTFTYKNLSLSANVIYKLGYYFRRTGTAISYDGLAYGGGTKDYANRWQKPGDELTTNVPSIQLPPADANRQYFYTYSSALVEKGDHIRLQDISLSYSLDKQSWKKNPFNRCEIYAYVNNVGILWRANHQGLDPDVTALTQGGTRAYPLPRTIALGIKGTF